MPILTRLRPASRAALAHRSACSADVVGISLIQKHPYFFAEDDVIALEASNDTARQCTVKKRKDGTQVLTATHAFKEGVTVIATVALPAEGAISTWAIRVENRLPIRPREAVIVHRVAFPQLGGLRAADDDNAQALAGELQQQGWHLISGGTDNHLVLVDLAKTGITGKQAEEALGAVGIVVNRNAVPFDTQPPRITSGIRLGTPAVTTRGFGSEEMKRIASLIVKVINNI